MREEAGLELALVSGVMLLLLVFGVAAVAVFVRTWRRERGKKK